MNKPRLDPVLVATRLDEFKNIEQISTNTS